jgi:hypothetical protein
MLKKFIENIADGGKWIGKTGNREKGFEKF